MNSKCMKSNTLPSPPGILFNWWSWPRSNHILQASRFHALRQMETALFHHHWLAQMQAIILPAKIINNVHQRCEIVCSFIPSSVGGCCGPGSHRLASEAINRHCWNYLLLQSIENVLYHYFSGISPSFIVYIYCIVLALSFDVSKKKKTYGIPTHMRMPLRRRWPHWSLVNYLYMYV